MEVKWAVPGSNGRPPACKAVATLTTRGDAGRRIPRYHTGFRAFLGPHSANRSGAGLGTFGPLSGHAGYGPADPGNHARWAMCPPAHDEDPGLAPSSPLAVTRDAGSYAWLNSPRGR